MAKKRKKSKGLSGVASKKNSLDFVKRAALVSLGLVAGTYANKLIAKKDSVSGTDLLGMDGQTSKYTTPIILIGAGLVGSTLIKNDLVKYAALGVSAAGAAGLINAASGKSLVSLNGDDENAAELMPGVGSPLLPGVGAEPQFTELSDDDFVVEDEAQVDGIFGIGGDRASTL